MGLAPIEGEIAARMVAQGLWATCAAAAMFAVIYLIAGPGALAMPNAVASAVLGAIAIAPKVTTIPKLYAGVLVALLLLGAELTIGGTIVAGMTVWVVVPNVALMLAGLRRAALFCLVVSVAEISLLAVAAQLNWIGPPIAMPLADLDMGLSIIGTLLLCAGFALIVLRVRVRLVDELVARQTELEAARAAAVEAAEAKERFFANLTHEIRTPLSGIAGTAELLEHEDLPANLSVLATDLAISTRALASLVNAMLDHARLRAGVVVPDMGPMSVAELAQELRSLFGGPSAAKGLELEVSVADDVPDWVMTDGVRLRRIAGNLVGNAVKFTERGGVAVSISRAVVGNGVPGMVLRVADTGRGVPPEQLPRLFEPFVQGDASITRKHGGTGLGLAIARELARLLGGEVAAESTPGVGSVFTASIPATAAEPPVQHRPAPTAASRPGIRVLLVEDHAVNRAVAAKMLERLGADVEVASDGAQAVAAARAGEFDLILMDLQMPQVDGITAARDIRAFEAAHLRARVPIIAMTGNAPEDYADDCAEAGMDGFLVKPVSMDALRRCLPRDTALIAEAS